MGGIDVLPVAKTKISSSVAADSPPRRRKAFKVAYFLQLPTQGAQQTYTKEAHQKLNKELASQIN